ncbi:MAG: heparinase II/III-family protein, partial [Cyclobacteriaceae bacterium]|nr:heparinase II/III-family protein [Cyclobacteriaceae bacterium]
HMDVGSFVMEADGVRWSSDFGEQDYESLESKGMKIFGKAQDAERWTIFRLNNFSHSTLTIDDELQKVDGYAKIDKYSDDDQFKNAVSDITSIYGGQVKKVVRGVGIKDERFVVVRDELETLNKTTKVSWKMLTSADVELNQTGATLTKDGKILLLKVEGSKNIQMKTWSTAPTNNYDIENPGTIMVGFECELPANSTQTFEVILVPESMAADANFTNLTLNEW